ncbi:MAG: hypothetical protein IJB83_02660 [Bacilli bacterium]|nr:hypothetical protein [Bacilli bacterium]
MSKTEPTKICMLKCLKCANVQTIRRRKSRLKKDGHIKHLWCWKCKERTKHLEEKEKEE